MSSIEEVNNEKEVISTLEQILLNLNQNKSTKELFKKLIEISTPKLTISILLSSIFNERQLESSSISYEDALFLISYFAQVDADTYLQEASSCAREKTEQLAKNNSSYDILVSDALLSVLVNQFHRNNVQITANMSASLVNLCKCQPLELPNRVIPLLKSKWDSLSSSTNLSWKATSTIAIRYATTIIQIAIQSEDSFTLAQSSGSLNSILNLLSEESDPLLQMSSLDILELMITSLPMHHKRAQWLFSNAVLSILLKFAGDDKSQADPILGGAAIRLISSICALGQRDSSLFRILANTNQHIFKSFRLALLNFEYRGAESNRLAFIDATCSFASSSNEALVLLLEEEEIRSGWLSLKTGHTKVKAAVLYSLANVLDPKKQVDMNGDEDETTSCHSMTDTNAIHLLDTLVKVNSPSTPVNSLLLTHAKSPFVELRLASYAVMNAMVKRTACTRILLSHAGVYDFLITRDNESTKEGKEAKFLIIENLLANENVKLLLMDNVVKKLERIVEQGPFYVESIPWEMATE